MIEENIAPDNVEKNELPDFYQRAISTYGGVNISIVNEEFRKHITKEPYEMIVNSMNPYGEFEQQTVIVTDNVPKFKYVHDNTIIPIWNKSVSDNGSIIYNTDAVFYSGPLNNFYN